MSTITLKPKIKLALSVSNKIPINTIINEQFDDEIKPYRDKVIYELKKTDILEELIIPLEKCLNQKTLNEAEKLRCGRDFELYKKLYLSICRHIIVNLTTKNSICNHQFIELINEKKLSLEDAIELAPHEMYIDRWRSLVEKKLSDIDKSIKDPEATTDLFWCGGCHRNKCTYFERQDRSADEPMTIHITCCYCGRRWKQ